jgi:hypothetical protein
MVDQAACTIGVIRDATDRTGHDRREENLRRAVGTSMSGRASRVPRADAGAAASDRRLKRTATPMAPIRRAGRSVWRPYELT